MHELRLELLVDEQVEPPALSSPGVAVVSSSVGDASSGAPAPERGRRRAGPRRHGRAGAAADDARTGLRDRRARGDGNLEQVGLDVEHRRERPSRGASPPCGGTARRRARRSVSWSPQRLRPEVACATASSRRRRPSGAPARVAVDRPVVGWRRPHELEEGRLLAGRAHEDAARPRARTARPARAARCAPRPRCSPRCRPPSRRAAGTRSACPARARPSRTSRGPRRRDRLEARRRRPRRARRAAARPARRARPHGPSRSRRSPRARASTCCVLKHAPCPAPRARRPRARPSPAA